MKFLRYCFKYKEVIEILGIMARSGYTHIGSIEAAEYLLNKLGHNEEIWIWTEIPFDKSPPDYLNVP